MIVPRLLPPARETNPAPRRQAGNAPFERARLGSRLAQVGRITGCLASLLCVVALRVGPAAGAEAGGAARRPNVLFIAIDDLNHWVGHLGRNAQAKTPNIDRLAAQGTTFTRAYCAAPICNPSRAALMTGLRPGATGVYANGDDWRSVVPADKTLLAAFRGAGYYVAGAGKIYHGRFERDEQWDRVEHPGGNPKSKTPQSAGPLSAFGPVDAPESAWSDARIADFGIAELGQAHDKPFFLAVGFHKPHMPWTVPRKYFDLHPLDQIELPPYQDNDLDDLPALGVRIAAAKEHDAIVKADLWRAAIQAYLAAGSFCDAQVGRVLDALEKSPHRDNTIVVLWGDHGWSLGEKHHWRKFALWEETTRAPFVWVVPGVTKPGSRCERTVDFMSIYPTLCDLCGIDVPGHVQGATLRPLLSDHNAQWTAPAITTFGQNNHAIRSAGWRYIRYADGGEELYDESNDPFEWTNLAGDDRYLSQKRELAKWLPTQNSPAVSGKSRVDRKNAE